MKVIICDDDRGFVDILRQYVERYEEEQGETFEIYAFQDIEKLCEFIKDSEDVELLFLDVIFKDRDGIQGAEEIRKWNQNIKIIFVSSYIEFATQGYEVDASGYLLKPLSYEVFQKKLQNIVEKIQRERKLFLCEDTDKGKAVIDFCDIMYLETYGRNVKIHTKKNVYLGHRRMKDYEKMLEKGNFNRCHAAYIVNMQFVQRIEGYTLILKDGTEIAVSKAKKKNFMMEFAGYVSNRIVR